MLLNFILSFNHHWFSATLEEEDGANDRTLMYYVNDGVYGSFNCILFDHAHVLPTLHKV